MNRDELDMAIWLAVDVAEVVQQLGTSTVDTLYARLAHRMDRAQFDALLRILVHAGLVTWRVQGSHRLIVWTGGRGTWPAVPDDPRD